MALQLLVEALELEKELVVLSSALRVAGLDLDAQ